MSTVAGPPRNHLFDGMRGLAAIAVLLFHLGGALAVTVPSGYLAVDCFFVLSGFVIRDAYQGRLEKGLSLGRFVEIRLVRLYPLYLVGMLFGLARAVGAIALSDPRAPSVSATLVALVSNVLLLPTPLNGTAVFPLNPPAWSLSLEMAINILFAAWLFRRSVLTLCALAAVGVGGLVFYVASAGDLSVGVTWDFYYSGAARALWGFLAGVLIARFMHARTARLPAITSVPVLAVLLLSLWFKPSEALRPAYDLCAALLVYPALVAIAANVRVEGVSAKAFGFLGDLSYPLYATHYPLIAPLCLVAAKAGLSVSQSVVGVTCACLFIAFLLALADVRVRAAISRKLHLRRSASTQVLSPQPPVEEGARR